MARAGAATIAMSAGFLTVFGIFGLVVSPLIASVQKYLPFATVVIGVALAALAIWLLGADSLRTQRHRGLASATSPARIGRASGRGSLQ
jgi:cytochrome c biogenesis protein CcdA